MTTTEFSNEFDTLVSLHNNSNGTSFYFDEYEKSVLLTSAQETLVTSLYNGGANGDAVEETEELRKYLDSLIKTYSPEVMLGEQNEKITSNSTLYKIKEDVWFIIYESVDLKNDAYYENSKTIQVIPMKHDEWHRVKNNPFKRPNKRKAVRLEFGDSTAEIVSEYPIENYKIRYISKPSPIILIDLEDGLKINNVSNKTECKLHTALHRTILTMAVQLALAKSTKASK